MQVSTNSTASFTKTNRTFWLLTLVIILLFIFSAIVIEGMFFDGLIYASVARNIAIGEGTFWKPIYQEVIFYEHPPLIFGLQSLFFGVLGHGFYVEKIFSVVIFIVTALVIIQCWRKLFPEDEFAKKITWLPLLCWCIIPRVMFAYPNNLLDTSMALLDVVSFYFFLCAISSNGKKWFYYILSGAFIFLAFIAKGPVGLFPLAVPFFYYIIYEKRNLLKGILYSFLLLMVFSLLMLILMQYPPANEFFTTYFRQQVLDSFEGNREKVNSIIGHFQIIAWLGMYLVPLFLMAVAGWFYLRKSKLKYEIKSLYFKHFLFLLLIAVSATFPIALSIKQRAFYLIPGFIFYGLAFAALLVQVVKLLFSHITNRQKMLQNSYRFMQAAFIFSLVYCIILTGEVGRDEKEVNDVKILSQHLKFGEKAGICSSLYHDWTLKAYMERYLHSSQSEEINTTRYFLTNKDCDADFAQRLQENGYENLDLPLKKINLYERK